jgi:hypothetical protein
MNKEDKFKSVSRLIDAFTHRDIQPMMEKLFRQLAYPWPSDNFRAVRAQVREFIDGKKV